MSDERASDGPTGSRASSTAAQWRRARASLGALTCLAGTAGCVSAPVNHYHGGAPALPALGEPYRASVLDQLAPQLVESQIQVVELVQDGQARRVAPVEGRAPAFTEFPMAGLQAASVAADPELCGAELDVLVGDDPGRIVTVQHDIDGSLHVLMGSAPVDLAGHAPSAGELQRRYDIGPLVDGGAAWSVGDRRSLGTALSRLDAEEIAYLRDLPFVRQPGDPDGEHAGFFHFGEGAAGGRIILLDEAFRSDGHTFIGPPDRAHPRSIFVILHEIGHALAELDRIMLVSIFERDRERYNEAVDVANQYVDALNERYAVVDRLARSRDRITVQRDIRTLEKEYRRIRRIMRDARRRLDDLADKIEGPPPMTLAYGELPGARRGPTPYGSTSIEEGFAEAFALYHLDPAALTRFSPAVHEWFAADHHLAAALYPPLEPVGPPPPGRGGSP